VINRTPVDRSLERTSIEKESVVSVRATCALFTVAAGRGSASSAWFLKKTKQLQAKRASEGPPQNEMKEEGNLA